MIDQLVKGNILVLSHLVKHFKDLIEYGELFLLGLLLQALEKLLLTEVKELGLCFAHFVAGSIDISDDLGWIKIHCECFLMQV